jgi:hypothetical protein
MERDALRELIRGKLADGSLPRGGIPHVSGGWGRGQVCAACEAAITPDQFVMEGLPDDGSPGVRFHVQCFSFWDLLRRPQD